MSKNVKKPKTTDRATLIALVLCFPYGIYRMWRKTSWHLAVKSAVTLVFAALIVAIVLPQTAPPVRKPGGVTFVAVEPVVEVFGPEIPASFDSKYSSYASEYVSANSVITDAEIKEIVYVYANDTGKYYHTSKCRHVYWKSKSYTLAEAYFAGYMRCEECDAPVFEY